MGVFRRAREAVDHHYFLQGMKEGAEGRLPLQLAVLSAIQGRPIEWEALPNGGTLQGVFTGEYRKSGPEAGAARLVVTPGDIVLWETPLYVAGQNGRFLDTGEPMTDVVSECFREFIRPVIEAHMRKQDPPATP
jgi:hypothetical protein